MTPNLYSFGSGDKVAVTYTSHYNPDAKKSMMGVVDKVKSDGALALTAHGDDGGGGWEVIRDSVFRRSDGKLLGDDPSVYALTEVETHPTEGDTEDDQ